jgi:hypothetical protein
MNKKQSPVTSILGWLLRVTELVPVLVGLLGFVISLVPHFELWKALGIDEPFERIIVGLVSLLLLSVGLELVQVLAPIRSAVSLSPDTAIASKLDSIETIASQTNCLHEIGILAFYPNRDALPDFPSFIKSAESDLLICGLSADTMIHHYGTLLRKRLEQGLRIRFLLPDIQLMENEKAVEHLAPRIEAQRTPDHLVDAMKYIALWKQEVENENLMGKLEIRLLNFIPPMGFIIVDGQKNHARIRVEQYVYKCLPDNRPSYEVVPTPRSNDLFAMLRTQLELCWNEANEWQPSVRQPEPSNQK